MSFAKKYTTTVIPDLEKEFSLKNPNSVPKLSKIVINVGIGKLVTNDKKDITDVVEAVKRITGQAPVVNKSRKSISNFKLREGMPVGISVTLRRKNMYSFLERLVTFVAPRIRDFRGFPVNSFDGRGNYSVGIREHTVFPEIPQDEVVKPFGLQITIATTATTNQQARKLLEGFHFPFTK